MKKPIKKIRAVIFDMDGVIVDSEPIHSKSLEILIRSYNKNPVYSKQGLIHTVGISGGKSYLRLMRNHNIHESLKVLRQKRRAIFVKLIKQKLSPMPGFIKLLTLFKKQGFKIALASNRLLEHVYLILENLGVKNQFDIIVGPSPNLRHKPYPDIYLETARQLKILPEECLALEDSESGIVSAKNAGMKVIAIPNRYTNHQDFSKADLLVKSLNDITIAMIQEL